MRSAPASRRHARIRLRPATPVLLLAVALVVGALVAVHPWTTPDAGQPGLQRGGVVEASKPRHEGRARFRVATLNLKNTLSSSAVAADIRQVIDEGDPSVIGFQERGGTRAAMKRALPAHWALRMPTTRPGTDLNPIAFDTRVWKARKAWPTLLTSHTWRRNRGNIAVDQYGVNVVLEHRETGHLVRALSFHMPSEIHDKRTGGPNWRHRDRVEAFWRMAASVVDRADRGDSKARQFVGMCDCNVREDRDTTKLLVRGKITRRADLATNYSAEEPGRRRSIDYVMAERKKNFRIVSWVYLDRGLATDHPGVVTTFLESKGAWKARTGR